MASNKVLTIINISLSLLAFLLILLLFGVKIPVLGETYENKVGAECLINLGEEYTPWDDLNNCCLEAKQQLGCHEDNLLFDSKKFDLVCETGSESTLKYWLNEEAYRYCTNQVIW